MEWRIGFRLDARDSEGRAFRLADKAMGGWNHVPSLWEEVDRRW